MDIHSLQSDFPILQRQIHGHRLVYLDNAATTQKPWQVLEAMDVYYCHHASNIHRGVHTLAEEATAMYEAARDKVRAFINAETAEEIIFVRNATEALNLIAFTYGQQYISSNDQILLTEMEHHANLLPWQRLSAQQQATLEFMPVTNDGLLQVDFSHYFSDKTKLVAFPHVSNVLGTINPAKQMIDHAHQVGAVAVVDAAQSVPHMPVDVQALGADFVVFSGHKMLGPDGIGVLYGRRELLETLDPYLVGGEMIKEVSYTDATWNDLPWKFEAGTPNIAGAIGLGAAIDYLENIGMNQIRRHEHDLTTAAMSKLSAIDGLTIYGPMNSNIRGGVVTFNIQDIHPHDVATILDQQGVAIRSGHHCAQPLTKRLGVPATCRASFYIYNDEADVDTLISGIHRAKKVFNR